MGTVANNLRDDFLTALKDIPNEAKEGYLEALQLNAHLLYHETPLELFLEMDKYDPIRSARRFVGYWNNRLSNFPVGDAFLPLRIWNGSMNRESVELLKSSWTMLLPDDSEGRPVAFLNFSSRDCLSSGEVSLADRERCLFYVLRVVSSKDESRTKGCVLLLLIDASFQEANTLVLWLDRIISSFPLHISEMHILPIGNVSDQPEFFERFIPYSLQLLLLSKEKGFSPEDYLHIHREDVDDSFATSLAAYGIDRKGIPQMIGGLWSQQQQHAAIERWVQAEQRYEALKPSKSDFTFPGRLETSQEEPRRTEDINSKMKKRRRRCQDAAIRVQHAYLEAENERLHASIAMFEGLLREAHRIIGGAEAEQRNS